MCDHKFQCLIGLIAVVILVNETQGSVESNGPKGISSIGLVDADGQLLNGDGIAIGQVEPGRPGKLVSDGGPDNAQHANAAIVPAGVFLRNENAIANLNVETADGHAEFVAGVMISTATTAPVGQSPPTGVATEALLYGSADGDTGPNFDANSALSAQHLTNVAPVRSVNMSFGNELEGSHVVDGNSLLTLFVDWSATQHNVLYVVAGNEFFLGVPGGPIPTDNFNGMVIATSEKTVDGFYRKVADRNAYADVVGSNRTVTSLMAPGEAIDDVPPVVESWRSAPVVL